MSILVPLNMIKVYNHLSDMIIFVLNLMRTSMETQETCPEVERHKLLGNQASDQRKFKCHN